MGLCPQHDVLWARLTVGEHMALYAAIKGSAGDGEADAGGGRGLDERVERARIESESLLAKVGLAGKLHAQALALSGGMKRKLCVAIALLGESSAVLLDEPTSGMDPHSRRATWELLQAAKAERALVLTTHYMDEADLLADRTAILADGRLQADGSSLFLKAKFGLGYTLTVQLALGESAAAVAGSGGGGGAVEREAVLQLLRTHVPGVLPLSHAGNEAAYRLPLGASGAFAALLRELDSQAAKLSVGSYGMSMTSMDEVFLALARRDPNQLRAADAKDAQALSGA
ncbi:P-loop containing nucleoside triphosphate hydrolase protein, partial [Pavlovales sp. CCMP2436]